MSTPTKERVRAVLRAVEDEVHPRRNLAERISDWNPDRRWYHPYVAIMWLCALGGLPHWTHLPPWAMAPVGLAGTISAVMSAKRHYDTYTYGDDQHQHAVRLTWAAGLMATAWLVFAGYTKPAGFIPVSLTALGLLIIGGVAFGSFYAHIRTKAPKAKAEVEQRRTEIIEQQAEVQAEKLAATLTEKFGPVLWRAGLTGASVRDYKDTRAGFTLLVEDDETKPFEIDGVRSVLGKLASGFARMYEPEGVQIAGHQVRVEETGSAHLFDLLVSTKNALRESIPYPMDKPVMSIKQPVEIGVYEDFQPIALSLLGVHGLGIGATGSGKTVVENNIAAGVLRCCDAELWIGGVKKLNPLVYPWLKPWFTGQTDRPALGYVAGTDPYEVLKMLADLYKFATLRNDDLGEESNFVPTPEDPAVFCLLEEASALLVEQADVKIKVFDSPKPMNGSALVAAITRMSRSAGVSLFMVTQEGLMEALGVYGSNAKRNITLRIVLKTTTDYDGQESLVGLSHVRSTRLTDKTMLVQPSVEMPRAIPGKAYVLDGADLIYQVAYRNTAHRRGLPEKLTSQLDYYADRWSRERLPGLVRIVEKNGFTWPDPPADGPSQLSDECETVGVVVPLRGHDRDDRLREITGRDGEMNGEDDPDMNMTAGELEARGMAKMDSYLAKVQKYGMAGKTISLILDAINANNAPAFIPADLLAEIITDKDQEGERHTAESVTAALAARPWNLPITTSGNQRGWPKDAMKQAIRDGIGTPDEDDEAVPQPRRDQPAQGLSVPQPLAAIVEAVQGRRDDEWVRTGDLAVLIGRTTENAEKAVRQQAAAKLGKELTAAPFYLTVTRRAEGSFLLVGSIRQAATETAAGTRRPPLDQAN